MMAVPPATPDTMPVDPTVAVPVVLLLHIPPVVASVRFVVAPAQTEAVPPITAGKRLTVNGLVAKHPPATVYVIIAVELVMPVAVPDEDPMLITAGLELVQVPPAGAEE